MEPFGWFSLQSDEALDLVDDVLEGLDTGDAPDIIITALEAALRTTPLPAFEAVSAIAAAELVAVGAGRPGPELPDEVVQAQAELAPLALFADIAHKAANRALGDQSELAEMWDSVPEGAEWRAAVADLARRLA